MFNKTKTKTKNFFCRQRSIKKPLAIIIVLSILFTAYAGWVNYNPEYAHAEVNIVKPIKDNRSIKERLWDDLDEYNFTLNEKINTILLIGICENRDWNPDAKHNNGRSVDRGLFMINDHYHKEVSNACAYDYKCALKEFVRIYREKGWREWACGKMLKFKD